MNVAAALDRLLEKRVIVNCEREPYLHRWYVLRTERVGVFIHRFVRSDEDRALHDHPWSFIVIPLWGGYIEHSDRLPQVWGVDLGYRIPVRRRVWPLISTRYRGTDYRHRVELVNERPSWSLFIRFKKVREWGFWPKTGFILWNKWWQDKCE
jgi:hypothetical protein